MMLKNRVVLIILLATTLFLFSQSLFSFVALTVDMPPRNTHPHLTQKQVASLRRLEAIVPLIFPFLRLVILKDHEDSTAAEREQALTLLLNPEVTEALVSPYVFLSF